MHGIANSVATYIIHTMSIYIYININCNEKAVRKRIKMRGNASKNYRVNGSFLREEFSSHLHAWIVAVSR